MNPESGRTAPRGHARPATEPAPGGQDVIDSVTGAWRADCLVSTGPSTSWPGGSASMLEDTLAECLAPWGLTKAEYGVLSALRSVGAPYELRPTDLTARLLLTSGGRKRHRAVPEERRPLHRSNSASGNASCSALRPSWR
jgi:hypothetical protein